MNIRVSRQLIGCADKLMENIIENQTLKNTLIVSPPGCGKTTMLRDVVRQVSNGVKRLNFYVLCRDMTDTLKYLGNLELR